MSRTNKRTEAAGKPDNPLTKLDSVVREAHGKLEQVRGRVKRDLSGKMAGTERHIAADEAERDLLHDDLKQSDIDTLNLLTINQQSKYDMYPDHSGRSQD